MMLHKYKRIIVIKPSLLLGLIKDDAAHAIYL